MTIVDVARALAFFSLNSIKGLSWPSLLSHPTRRNQPKASPKIVQPRKKIQTRRYVVALHKGGVGKSTTVIHLAGAIAAAGKKVLVIDCDSQGDTSSVFAEDHRSLPTSVADLFAATGISASDVIQSTHIKNIFLVPADRRLESFEQTCDFQSDPASLALRDAISEVEDEFDYVLLDTGTRPHLTSYAALSYADVAIVPMQPGWFTVNGLGSIATHFEQVRQSINPNLIVRYFHSQLRKNEIHAACRDTLVEVLGADAVLSTEIPDGNAINTAIYLGTPMQIHSPRSKAAQAYRDLAAELDSIVLPSPNSHGPK